jgi:hypothetical protein
MTKESEFIKVAKGDEVIEVHPLALADHKRLGWVEVEEAPAEETNTEAKPDKTPRAHKPKAEKPE